MGDALTSPLKPFIPWQGGKRWLWKNIRDDIPPHRTYVEPFVGGGAVFMAKPLAEHTVLADANCDLIRLWRNVQSGTSMESCPLPRSKEEFQAAMRQREGWCRTYTNAKCGSRSGHFISKGRSCKVGGSVEQHPIVQRAPEYAAKLKDVDVRCADWKEIAAEHRDDPEAFLFIDPPYPGTARSMDYAGEAGSVTAGEVCSFARGAKAKVMVTLNDTPANRIACTGLNIRSVDGVHKLRGAGGRVGAEKVRELLVTNY